jgi:hypothetical protein
VPIANVPAWSNRGADSVERVPARAHRDYAANGAKRPTQRPAAAPRRSSQFLTRFSTALPKAAGRPAWIRSHHRRARATKPDSRLYDRAHEPRVRTRLAVVAGAGCGTARALWAKGHLPSGGQRTAAGRSTRWPARAAASAAMGRRVARSTTDHHGRGQPGAVNRNSLGHRGHCVLGVWPRAHVDLHCTIGVGPSHSSITSNGVPALTLPVTPTVVC